MSCLPGKDAETDEERGEDDDPGDDEADVGEGLAGRVIIEGRRAWPSDDELSGEVSPLDVLLHPNKEANAARAVLMLELVDRSENR